MEPRMQERISIECIPSSRAVDRTRAGVMASLRTGRAYAVARGDENVLLQLDAFRVLNNGQSAGIGETLHGSTSGGIIVRVGVSAVDGKPYAAKLRIIRSGHVIRQVEGHDSLAGGTRRS